MSQPRTILLLRLPPPKSPPGGPSRQAWKSVHKQLQKERKAWQHTLADRAGSQDWAALRALKHTSSKANWQPSCLMIPAGLRSCKSMMSAIFCKAPPAATSQETRALHQEVTNLGALSQKQKCASPWPGGKITSHGSRRDCS